MKSAPIKSVMSYLTDSAPNYPISYGVNANLAQDMEHEHG